MLRLPSLCTIKQQKIFYASGAGRVKKNRTGKQKKKTKTGMKRKKRGLAFQTGKRYTVFCRLRDEDRVLCDLPV